MGAERVPYDAGVAEFYAIKGAPYIRRLVELLGLPMRCLSATPTFFWRGHRLDNDDDFLGVFGVEGVERLEDFWRRGLRLRRPEDYADSGFPKDHPWSRLTFTEVLKSVGHPEVEDFLRMQVNSDLACEPDEASGVFAFDNLLVDHPDYCDMFTIEGGNARLIERLVDRVRAPLRSGVSLSAVHRHGEGFRLEASGEEIVCEGLLLAVPRGNLGDIVWGDRDARDGIARHRALPASSSAYLRVTLLFARRFWGAELPESYFVDDAFGGVTVYDHSPYPRSPEAPGVLSWLLAGRAARQLATCSDEVLVDKVLGALPSPLVAGRSRLRGSSVDRWVDTEAPLRDVDQGARPSLPEHQPVASIPGLVVAGDYMYDGTVNGALESAVRGCSALLCGLGHPAAVSAADVWKMTGLS